MPVRHLQAAVPLTQIYLGGMVFSHLDRRKIPGTPSEKHKRWGENTRAWDRIRRRLKGRKQVVTPRRRKREWRKTCGRGLPRGATSER